MKLFLAGCEGMIPARVVALTGHKNILISNYHLKKTNLSQITELVNKNNMNVIMDSGLFTMMFGVGKGKTYELPQLIDYTEEYISKMKDIGFNNLTIVESDVHKILGMDAVFTLREKFEKSGLDVIYVWHMEEGIDGLIKMSNKYKYIALSVPELRILFKKSKQRYQSAIFNLLGRIKSNTKELPKIHLLGNTVMETMDSVIPYSCDSSSWLYGVRFHSCCYFKDGKIVGCERWSQVFEDLKNHVKEKQENIYSELMTYSKNEEYILNMYIVANAFYKYQMWLNANYNWIGEKNGKENNR